MAIDATYREMLINDFIKQKLEEGILLTAEDITEELEIYLSEKDLTIPQFISLDHYTQPAESSSAEKNEITLTDLRQDLRALYKEMLRLTKDSINSYERWALESNNIEKRLIDLEDRISNLLILTQDTEGYHSIIIDNFSDTFKVDSDWTTTEVDIHSQSVELGPTGSSFKQIFLNNLDPIKDLSFEVRSTTNLAGRNDFPEATLADIFNQESKVWWTNVKMNKPGIVTCELTIRLGDVAIPINRILLELHESAEASPVTIVPLLSIDNINFDQIPSNTFVLESRNTALFTFPDKETKWIKFILTKKGPDVSGSDIGFGYQFGFKSIKFYQQAFDSDIVQSFVSAPLFIIDEKNKVKRFEKLTLETCERIEDNTTVKYYVTFSNNAAVPLTDGEPLQTAAVWYPITPINRTESLSPQVLDIGDINEEFIGDTEIVKISYDGRATNSNYVNPAQAFQLLSESISGSVADDTTTASGIRYSFVNAQDRILNYQVKVTDYIGSGSGSSLDINESSLTIFRNIGEKGILTSDTNNLVRDNLRGWGFSEPYYTCVIEVKNPEGMEIDVGDSPMIVDDVAYTNKISARVLTGKTSKTTGLHRIKVHKQNWKEVVFNATSLVILQSSDRLYPFNHKLLIEGYLYDVTYPTSESKVYAGVDLFAETVLKKVSPFDFAYNTPNHNYDIYAIDLDAPYSHNGGNDPTWVFLTKVDDANPDSQNERFMIRFKQINLLQKYLRLRADLSTSDSKITPSLQSYKIKLG